MSPALGTGEAAIRTSFNEAAGIHRRKRGSGGWGGGVNSGFNEAAGIHRRKHLRRAWIDAPKLPVLQ